MLMHLQRLIIALMVFLSMPAQAADSGGDSGILSGITNWLLTYINKIIDAVNTFITGLWDTVVKFFKQLLLTILDMLKDFFLWIFDQILSLTLHILDGLGELLSKIDITNLVSGLPESVTNMMGLLGIGHCLSVIAIACTIRILMQLIPFVRLGS